MAGTQADSNPELDPAVRETEAELRALLQPGGSTDRVWHLIEFSAGYEAKMESRQAAQETEQRSREQFRSICSRTLRLARLPVFRAAAIAAVVLLTMVLTQPLSDMNVAPTHLSYTVPAEDIAPLGQTQMTNLIMALSSEHAQERADAEKAVVACGPRILPLLTPLTKSNDPELRKRAERLIESVERGTCNVNSNASN